jgi:p-cumate 2,3-dioxygenase beta subunit
MATNQITRSEIEDFLFHEAALLDEWKLDVWLDLLTDDAQYFVPSNDRPEADPEKTLFLIADDIRRIRARVTRLKDRNAHAEFPASRTRRMISNVRVTARNGTELAIEANFVIYRFRRDENIREYVGRYRYRLQQTDAGLRIAKREAILDAQELGALGSVSFIL